MTSNVFNIDIDSTSAMTCQIYPEEYAITRAPKLQDIQAVGKPMQPGTHRIKSR
jgi:hypothetical protein